MPIYEYSCSKCGKEFEELVFDGALPACPHCGFAETQKLMSQCAHSSASGGEDAPASGGGGGCAGCSGGHCATCGH